MKRRTTIADVAQAAKVSLMTVSRAVNNKPGLGDEVRQRVLAVAAELDYRPSKIARSLATRQTTTVGLVIPSISNSFYAQIAQGVEDIAYANGYSVFLINTTGDLIREQAVLISLLTQDVAGAILCSLRLPQKEILEIVENFPATVLFNRELDQPQPNVVTINIHDERAAQEAVRHFVDGGRRRIAYIGGPEDAYSSQCRLSGYCIALTDANIPFDLSLVMHIMPGIEQGKAAAKRLFLLHPGVDAILAFNDMVAIGVLQACQAAGKRVPEDIAIIGADDIPLASIIRPQLSTSGADLEYVGQLSMQTLLEMFVGEISTATYRIEPKLILRETA